MVQNKNSLKIQDIYQAIGGEDIKLYVYQFIFWQLSEKETNKFFKDSENNLKMQTFIINKSAFLPQKYIESGILIRIFRINQIKFKNSYYC